MATPSTSPIRAAVISLVTGVIVLSLKAVAAQLTGSVALLSDALESIVNVVAASIALWAVSVSRKPADDDHPWGHAKAEAFSAGAEGVLIVLAAVAIVRAALGRFADPQPATELVSGASVSIVASAVNALLAWYLVREGKRHNSGALRADGIHVFTDVVTSVGVLVGIGLASATGFWILDPILAIVVALQIVRSGWGLMRGATGILMDESAPPSEVEAFVAKVNAVLPAGSHQERLRARHAGHHVFVELVLHVPSTMTVGESHDLCDRIEATLVEGRADVDVVIHVEPEGPVGVVTEPRKT